MEYKLNPNDTANFNIELEDESYLKDLVDDIHESKIHVVFDSDKKPPTKGLLQKGTPLVSTPPHKVEGNDLAHIPSVQTF